MFLTLCLPPISEILSKKMIISTKKIIEHNKNSIIDIYVFSLIKEAKKEQTIRSNINPQAIPKKILLATLAKLPTFSPTNILFIFPKNKQINMKINAGTKAIITTKLKKFELVS